MALMRKKIQIKDSIDKKKRNELTRNTNTPYKIKMKRYDKRNYVREKESIKTCH